MDRVDARRGGYARRQKQLGCELGIVARYELTDGCVDSLVIGSTSVELGESWIARR